MNQPELGQKISELRKHKGLTQEELVERCNVSIRTLQRIEAGEVQPRSYTIKSILASLDYDPDEIFNKKESGVEKLINQAKAFLFIDISPRKDYNKILAALNTAWIFGIVYFGLGFLEVVAEYFRYEEDNQLFENSFYIIIKILVLIAYTFFMRGFIVIGSLFDNYLLKIISFVLIGATIIIYGYDIASLFYNSVEREFILGGAALTFGVIVIIYGIAVNRLGKDFGRIAELAGILEILAGVFYLTIILFFISELILIPAEILEIIILYKAGEIVRRKYV